MKLVTTALSALASATLVSAALTSIAVAQPLDLPRGFVVEDAVPAGTFQHISGVTVRDDGAVFVSDLGGADPSLSRVNLDGSVDRLIEGLPLGSPGRMLMGDGRPALGTDLILADWNGTGMSGCCGGQVLRIDPETGAVVDTLSAGSPGVAVGDAFGLAMGVAGAFPGSLYVMDFQGASKDLPFLFRAGDGAPSRVYSSGNLWTTDRKPGSMVMGRGDYGASLYIVDGANPPKVWSLDARHNLRAFAQGAPLATPVAIAQAPAGPFAGQLFVLDPAAHAIFMVAPGGGISLFADGLVGTQFSDLGFAPDGQSMYVGAGDRLLRVSLAPLCP